jgi:molybdenum cofactor biosynthesis protein MoaC
MEQNFRMIDVGEKSITRRRAVATGTITVCSETAMMIKKGDSPKGNILAMAEVAGIMASKNTWQLLPLCHPLILDSVRIWFEQKGNHIQAYCEVICHGKTGVEMEALVGVNTCLLTIYDLAKAVDPVIEISDVHLQLKEGGKSGVWLHPKELNNSKLETKNNNTDIKKDFFHGLNFAVGTLSDRASKGEYTDLSGPIIKDYFQSVAGQCVFYEIIPDEKDCLKELVLKAAHSAIHQKVDVLFLTGGTGISSRDITPETVSELASKELVGFGELQRQHGSKYTKAAWLSRASAYVVENTLVVLFPGSPKAVAQGMEVIAELVPHAIKMMKGLSHS